MKPVEKVPGITFHIESASLSACTGRAEIHADVNDPALWEKVLTQLDGFRVYTVQDLTTSIVEVLQQDQEEQKKAYEAQVEVMRQENVRLRQQVSFLEKSLEEMSTAYFSVARM